MNKINKTVTFDCIVMSFEAIFRSFHGLDSRFQCLLGSLFTSCGHVLECTRTYDDTLHGTTGRFVIHYEHEEAAKWKRSVQSTPLNFKKRRSAVGFNRRPVSVRIRNSQITTREEIFLVNVRETYWRIMFINEMCKLTNISVGDLN
jgi:hypothetical protein